MLFSNQKKLTSSLILWFTLAGCVATKPDQACQVMDAKLQGHYSGDCLNDKAHGVGLAIGKHKYEGEFVEGLPDGQGTYTWADGEKFNGLFIKGVPQIPHVGCYVTDPRLRGTYNGECRNAQAEGKGKAEGIDTYEGEFFAGKPDGQGTYIWSNGDYYIGQFKEGLAHGRGIMKYADGEEELGPWAYGKPIN
jgi:hypothetical protein